jgi:hypothetical protein
MCSCKGEGRVYDEETVTVFDIPAGEGMQLSVSQSTQASVVVQPEI